MRLNKTINRSHPHLSRSPCWKKLLMNVLKVVLARNTAVGDENVFQRAKLRPVRKNKTKLSTQKKILFAVCLNTFRTLDRLRDEVSRLESFATCMEFCVFGAGKKNEYVFNRKS